MSFTTHTLEPAKWVENYADALYAYAMVRVNDPHHAEDIVQETFVSAWKARDQYKSEASEKNWLYSILKNKIIDHFRKQASSKLVLETGEEQLYFDEHDHWTKEAEPKEWAEEASSRIEQKEFYNILELCKNKLKEIQRPVFVMKYMEDIDSDTICSMLNITAANYWVLIHRAKLHLRRCLEKNWMSID